MSIESGHFGYWVHKYSINDRLTLIGHSRGANRTGFIIPELGLYLDAGIQHGMRAQAVFLTHGHSDHSHGLPMIISDFDMSSTTDEHVPDIFCPNALEKFITSSLKSHMELTTCFKIPEDQYKAMYNVIGLDHNMVGPITIKNREYLLETFECDHGVPCLGYGLSETKQKLQEKYYGLQGSELKELKEQGIQITQSVHEKLFVFLGDTTVKVFEDNPNILEYPTVIVECNFIDPEHIQKAKKKKHVHWDNLKPLVKSNPQTNFILIHFSMQYRMEDILLFFESEKTKEGISNIHVWENAHSYEIKNE